MRDFVRLIHERALLAAGTLRTSENELIGILQEMDQCRGYFDYECQSLWDYCKKILKLSDYNSSTMIGIARKSIAVPELKAAVVEGRLELSKARKIVPVLTEENKSHWLSQAETLSKRDLEREVAECSPKLSTKESAKPISRRRVQFGCGLDEDIFAQFKEVQDMVSQKTNKSADFEETLAEMILFYKEKNDPRRKAERSQLRKTKRSQMRKQENQVSDRESQIRGHNAVGDRKPQINGHNAVGDHGHVAHRNKTALLRHSPGYVVPARQKSNRRYPAKLKHQINLRDGRQCTHKDSDEKRCEHKRWLQFHHKTEVQHGGKDTLDNLQTLCWAHHKMTHEKNGVSDLRRTYDMSPRLSG